MPNRVQEGERQCAHLCDNAHALFWTRRLEIEERARKIANNEDLLACCAGQRRYFARGFPHAENNMSPNMTAAVYAGWQGVRGLGRGTSTDDALETPFEEQALETQSIVRYARALEHELALPHCQPDEVKGMPRVRRTRQVPWGPPSLASTLWPASTFGSAASATSPSQASTRTRQHYAQAAHSVTFGEDSSVGSGSTSARSHRCRLSARWAPDGPSEALVASPTAAAMAVAQPRPFTADGPARAVLPGQVATFARTRGLRHMGARPLAG